MNTQHTPGPAKIRIFTKALLKTNQSELKADSNRRIGIKMNNMICGCMLPIKKVLSPTYPMLFYRNPNNSPANKTMGE